MSKTDIRHAEPDDLPAIRALFAEYAASLAFDLGFQGFANELASLPGAYAPPGGALLVAADDGVPVGCVGVRRLDAATCELKRLYVRPESRGGGTGRRLTQAALAEAARLGYARIRLDTVPGMERAQALYEELGFRDVAAYTANPVPGTRFLELDLGGAS